MKTYFFSNGILLFNINVKSRHAENESHPCNLQFHVKGKFYYKTIPVLYITFIFVTAFHLCYCGVLGHIVYLSRSLIFFKFYFQVSLLSYILHV